MAKEQVIKSLAQKCCTPSRERHILISLPHLKNKHVIYIEEQHQRRMQTSIFLNKMLPVARRRRQQRRWFWLGWLPLFISHRWGQGKM
jgi:hypothetical protein